MIHVFTDSDPEMDRNMELRHEMIPEYDDIAAAYKIPTPGGLSEDDVVRASQLRLGINLHRAEERRKNRE